MREAAAYPTSFIAIEGAIGLELVAKNPLAGDDVSIPRRRHKIPSVVAEESAVLRSHSIEPVGILDSGTGGGGNRGVPADRGNMQVKPLARALVDAGGAARAMSGCRRGAW